jgi:hypothetical protein
VDKRRQDSYQVSQHATTGRSEGLDDAAGLPGAEAELTPIFRALAERAADHQVEHFHRDPLAAPLPSFLAPVSSAPRMMPQAVADQNTELPAPRLGSDERRAVPSRRRAAHAAESERPVAQLGAGGSGAHSVPAERSGRHRVLRSVGRTHWTMPPAAHQPKHPT